MKASGEPFELRIGRHAAGAIGIPGRAGGRCGEGGVHLIDESISRPRAGDEMLPIREDAL